MRPLRRYDMLSASAISREGIDMQGRLRARQAAHRLRRRREGAAQSREGGAMAQGKGNRLNLLQTPPSQIDWAMILAAPPRAHSRCYNQRWADQELTRQVFGGMGW